LTEFGYLSVFASIVLGVGVSRLLTGAGRLVQRRRGVELHLPTLCWLVFLLLLHIQVWWATFTWREVESWTFLGFVLFLTIPVAAFFLAVLVLPDLAVARKEEPDLERNFHQNRTWFFGILTALPVMSLAQELVLSGELARSLDTVARVLLIPAAALGALVGGERFHRVHAPAMLLFLAVYTFGLFLRLG